MSEWTSERIARLPDASPEDVLEIAEAFAELEAERRELARHLDAANLRERRLVSKVERLEWLWAQAENLDPDLVDGAERAWAALEGREP